MEVNKKRSKATTPERKLEKVEEKRVTSINNLNDDCLVLIFQNLTSIADKVRMELVCKRWRELSKYSWKNFNSLDLKSETWGVKKLSSPSKSLPMNIKVFTRIGKVCGANLTKVELSVDLFGEICAWTRNIREVDLFKCSNHSVVPLGEECECYDAWPEVITHLLPQCENITKFHLNFSINRYLGTDLGILFTNMKKLKSLHVYNLSDLMLDEDVPSGELWVTKLSLEETEDILFESIPPQFQKEVFFSIFHKCTKLQKLVLSKLNIITLECILEALKFQVGNFKNLQFRALTRNKNYRYSPRLLANIALWKNLETLCVIGFNNIITDHFLKLITKYCKKLTCLSICCEEDCEHITDDGVDFLAELPRLNNLTLAGLPFKNPVLTRIRDLEILNVSCCSSLEDQPLCDLLRRAEKLQVICIIGCGSLSLNILDLLLAALRIRNSPKALTIFVENERVEDYFSGGNTNLMKFETDFSNSKYCLEHDDLRPRMNEVEVFFSRT